MYDNKIQEDIIEAADQERTASELVQDQYDIINAKLDHCIEILTKYLEK